MRNPYIQDTKRTWLDAIFWLLGGYREKEKRPLPPDHFSYPALLPPYSNGLPSAQWIGHSTFLIQAQGVAFLTDPIWGAYCSPVPLACFKRLHPPPIFLQNLPFLDFILISHNHYDHLDRNTVDRLHRLYPDLVWIVSRGLSSWFGKRGIQNVVELGWGESYQDPRYKVTAVPAQHFSGRSLWDKNRTGWNGYVWEAGKKRLYFTGDTGYNPVHFQQIGRCWPSMDVSLIPIGTYMPRPFMSPVHIDPFEAVRIHQEVASKLSLGMHWGTFRLSQEPLDRPPYDLFLAMQQAGLDFASFLPIPIGARVNW